MGISLEFNDGIHLQDLPAGAIGEVIYWGGREDFVGNLVMLSGDRAQMLGLDVCIPRLLDCVRPVVRVRVVEEGEKLMVDADGRLVLADRADESIPAYAMNCGQVGVITSWITGSYVGRVVQRWRGDLITLGMSRGNGWKIDNLDHTCRVRLLVDGEKLVVVGNGGDE